MSSPSTWRATRVTPATCTDSAAPPLAPPAVPATSAACVLACCSSRVSRLTSSCSATTRGASWAGAALSAAASAPSVSRAAWNSRNDCAPVVASIRRTPAATPLSEAIANSPMSPVARTWVPPHSSVLKPGTDTTRTLSPYFSPKSAMAPAAIASSVAFTSVVTVVFFRIRALTIASISSHCSRVTALKCTKSNRSRSGATRDPACLTCAAQHLAQRGVEQVGRGVIAPGRVPRLAADLGGDEAPRAQRALDHLHGVCARPLPGAHHTRHPRRASRRGNRPDVRHLAARFEVERRLTERHEAGLAGGERRHFGAGVIEDGQHLRVHGGAIVAAEHGVANRFERGACGLARSPGRVLRRATFEGALRSRLRPLCIHGRVETLDVEPQLARLDHVLDEVARNPEGVVEPERRLARHDAAGRRGLVEHVLELWQPVGEDDVEPLLLAADDARNRVAVGDAAPGRRRRTRPPSCPRACGGTAP